MSEKEKTHILTLKEIQLKHGVIKYKADLKHVDFGIHILWKEKPPEVANMIVTGTDLFQSHETCEKDYVYEYSYGEGIVLTHLGCIIPSKDKDIEQNRKIVTDNAEGLVKIYDGVFKKFVELAKRIDEHWDELKQIDNKLKEIFGELLEQQ